MAVYIDDILLAAKSQQKIDQVKADLGKRFHVKDMGELHYFLGVSVKQIGKIWISQHAYTEAVLKKFTMEHLKPACTPTALGMKLLKGTEESVMVDDTLYQSAVGNLLYLSGWTRPDIAFAVRVLFQPHERTLGGHKTYPQVSVGDDQLWS